MPLAFRRFAIGTAVAVAGLVALAPPSAAAATVTADYRLLNTRSSSVGTPPQLTDLVDVGNATNAFEREKVDDRRVPVLGFPKGNGVQLSPTTGVVPNETYSIVVLLRMDIEDRWIRLIDFKHGTSDRGLYFAHGGFLNFYSTTADGPTQVDAGTWVQVVLTRSSTNVVRGFVDGIQQWRFKDNKGRAVIDGSDQLRFFQDPAAGVPDEDAAGAVARIRLFDGPLSPTQVAALDRLPATATIELSPGTGSSDVRVTGRNFGPTERVKLTLTDAVGATFPLGTATTDVQGAFAKTVSIPPDAATGQMLIVAKGRTSGLRASAGFGID
jgi:concanavalin A-like lectin/glucanase superfamily protein